MEHNCAIYINKIKQLNTRLANKELTRRGIKEYNGEQSKILHVLWKKDGISSKEIADKTGLTLNTLTTMLARMENMNLIKKKISEKDKRKTIIELTDFAKTLEKEYREIIDEIVLKVFAGFSEIEIVKFEEYLERVINNIEKNLKDKE
ncbi:MarR family winged helix-turn-helix transcriptional regulator [Fusobacterium gastrosuis]|uniref:MarR family winged helix-turn-helix transcriptional regulator n=1 Tax=Fusobacterium gastrosuis TaxID=1755100 RepID=UPI001F5022C2|nr:MarR family transcriptional regulator [Fusobacterium gastrosuis]MDY5306617.1 MarR family transcriptional regulator [Fusobacterium gastrosuis]